MRHVVIAGACALLLATPAVTSAQAGGAPKFAYINSQQLFQIAPGRAEAQATYEKEMPAIRAQIQKLSDSLQQLSQAYAKEEVSLSPTAKEARLKALREKEAEFQDRAQKLNDQAAQRETELMQPVLDMIKKALEDVRTEDGYAMIFDVAAGGALAAFDKNLDITDRVASRLKLSAPKAAAAKPAGGPVPAASGVTTRKPPTQ
jgi:outer membrane protein